MSDSTSRREFLHGALRWACFGALAALGGASGARSWRGRGESTGGGRVATCSQCAKLSSCGLPPAVETRKAEDEPNTRDEARARCKQWEGR